ncbi:DNA helicase RecQ [Aristophania vespae]|uniref:DNA helicase RecQ n=1 Tax=Aristophania vespae TaxID=2697033 RepID=A0A6P1NDK3_9PROT|nr:DNA helicase RecQ [Aristophania vespae]QHI95543.1 DNA helicase RecQ [Aristophania vespae]
MSFDHLCENPSPREILKQVFGFDDFRGLQEEAISTLMQGEDVLVLMPTGGGKSLCYQVAALCRDGMGLVISPLIALMEDQVTGLKQAGVRAAALHSELDYNERIDLWNQLKRNEIDLLYLSPEGLLTPSTLEFLKHRSISLIAIDEAHCVSAWGHDFRPEYRELSLLKDQFPSTPRIALTATADERTRNDILSVLKMERARILTASFHRKNLFIQAQPKYSETRQLLATLETKFKEGSAIIYCGSRRRTERIATYLTDRGYTALPFHAGLSPLEKKALLLRFRSGESMIVVATIAFGMGIDRPDVRVVIHLDMPHSPESYYQQIGRAGRDGDPAYTLLLYGGEDIARARYWLDQSAAPESERHSMRSRLETMIALTETVNCRTQTLLACFGEELTHKCNHCDNCVNPIATFNGVEAAQKVLSAIYRTGERFGAVMIANVLRGRKTELVERHNLEALSVFGIGKDKSEQWWRMVIRQLIAKGAVKLGNDHGGLALNRDIARPLLRGEEELALKEDEGLSKTLGQAKKQAFQEDDLSDYETELFQALKSWRRGEAFEQEIPPYIIFHDTTLREIARHKPQKLDDLEGIKGVGKSKLERYGRAVIDVIKNPSIVNQLHS